MRENKNVTKTKHVTSMEMNFHVHYFVDVSSGEEINKYVKENQPNLCIFDASTIISSIQISQCVYNALETEKLGNMRSKSIYMEMLRCLSPDGRLSGAFKHIAVSASTKNAVVITFEDKIPEIPGIGKEVNESEFFAKNEPNFELINEIYQITNDMLKVYSHEEIILATLAITTTDLVRSRSL